ncbi:MAG TPA: M14 family metallopeptidase, partial [Vicinamibacterales bacterium]
MNTWRRMASIVSIGVVSLLVAGAAGAQAPTKPSPGAPKAAAKAWPLTRPEATRFAETSRYDDVMAFMKAMAAASPQIHLTTYGYTYEGRPLPLAVIGAPDATPEAVRATKKTRIYIQGNIHAGEVEGKEALLWLLRSIAKGERAAWFDSVVLLINPIYNADGNERVNLRNRGRQNGPVGGMGQRHNAQDFDLNRDCTKLETSEGRSLARMMTQYDPHIAIDLHTTDGSAHGFYLTYQTSVSPNTSPGLVSLARNDLFPWVTRTVKAKHGWDFFYYGNISRQGGDQAWYNDLDLYKPRYTQTYFGIRNRLGILVETYSYATFEDRIEANYWFLEEVINFAVKNGETIRKTTAAADSESIVGKEQAVRGKLVKAPGPVQVVMADTVEERNPFVPDVAMLRRAT